TERDVPEDTGGDLHGDVKVFGRRVAGEHEDVRERAAARVSSRPVCRPVRLRVRRGASVVADGAAEVDAGGVEVVDVDVVAGLLKRHGTVGAGQGVAALRPPGGHGERSDLVDEVFNAGRVSQLVGHESLQADRGEVGPVHTVDV